MNTDKPSFLSISAICVPLLGLIVSAVLVHRRIESQTLERENVRTTVVSYLSQPRFSSENFLSQTLGSDATFQVFNVDEGMLYFSISTDRFDGKNMAFLKKLTHAMESVEFGALNGGGNFQLGNYTFSKPGEYFFRIPKSALRVDPKATIRMHFGKVEYVATMRELYHFLSNRSVYGGYVWFSVAPFGGKLANHGAYVARRGEPSLTRLVRAITKDCRSQEERAQALLDFVTTHIVYDLSELSLGIEVLKKGNEMLMSRRSDCSGMGILTASLFEQAGLSFRLIYLRDPWHLSLAVEGAFPKRNGLHFSVEGKEWFVAEPCEPGFRIGETLLSRWSYIDDIVFVQEMGPGAPIRSVTGSVHPFLMR